VLNLGVCLGFLIGTPAFLVAQVEVCLIVITAVVNEDWRVARVDVVRVEAVDRESYVVSVW